MTYFGESADVDFLTCYRHPILLSAPIITSSRLSKKMETCTNWVRETTFLIFTALNALPFRVDNKYYNGSVLRTSRMFGTNFVVFPAKKNLLNFPVKIFHFLFSLVLETRIEFPGSGAPE